MSGVSITIKQSVTGYRRSTVAESIGNLIRGKSRQGRDVRIQSTRLLSISPETINQLTNRLTTDQKREFNSTASNGDSEQRSLKH